MELLTMNFIQNDVVNPRQERIILPETGYNRYSCQVTSEERN